MYISNLQIVGFKSFAQKLNVAFGDGITAIVGPNGCGKTNIVDAIRWVLGEQRPSILRTEKMEEVIFGGSNGRKPLGMAEVSLVIENTKNILPVEFSQVQVTRRLFRSGESDYLLNNTPCRLKDVIDLFLDTGMGAYAYSVIELGMVDDILSGRVDARRRLFDEASGVMKYKVRRHEALNKLRSTEADLLRINDIIMEVEKKVNSLKYQVGKARRHEIYKGRLKKLEIDSARREYELIRVQREPLQAQLQTLKVTRADAASRVAAQEEKGRLQRAEHVTRSQEAAHIREQVQGYVSGIHKSEESVSVYRERKRSLEERILRNSDEEKGLKERIEVVQKQKETSEAGLEEATRGLQTVKVSHRDSQEGLSESDKAYAQHKIAAAQGGRRISQLLPQYAEKVKEIDHLRKERDDLISKREGWIRENQSKLVRIQELDRNIEPLREQIAAVASAIQRNVTSRDALTVSLRNLERLLQDRDGSLRSRRAEHAAVEARFHVVEESLHKWEGFERGVQYLLSQTERVPGIKGLVGEMLRIPGRYAQALQVSLGNADQYLLMENVTAALGALAFLKQQGGGHAYFLPLDALPSLNGPRIDRNILPQPGLIGWAAELVSCAEEFEQAKRFLLRDILVVEDLPNAINCQQYLREHGLFENGLRIVTLEGDLIKNGLLGGGRAGEAMGGTIERRADMEQLGSQRAELEMALARETELYHQALAERDSIAERICLLDVSVETDRALLLELERRTGGLQSERSGLDQRASSVQQELAEAGRKLEALAVEIERAEFSLAGIEKEKTEAEQSGQQLQLELGQFESDKEERTKEVQELNLQVVSLQWKCNQLKDDISRLEEIETDVRGTLARKYRESSEARKEIGQIEQELLQIEAGLEKTRLVCAEAQQRLSASEQVQIALEKEIAAIEEEILQLRTTEQSSRESIYEIEMNISDLEHRASSRRERIRDEYGVDIDQIVLQEEIDVEKAQQSIEDLREKMRQLGLVNLAALHEYEEEKTRFDFLSGQQKDLVEAKESLRQTIIEINRTARKRFTRTFGLIRKNFRQTFVQFFGSGKGDLQLTPGVDPLEADVEIRACTRGTIHGSIDLFSGGEKTLTAIALLFAIYLVKPSPFCILDEIDAPLDDTNVVRFTSALREFAKSTQFIVVTHNKRTMEAADRLYGVTMEEEGISSLVSVSFEKAA